VNTRSAAPARRDRRIQPSRRYRQDTRARQTTANADRILTATVALIKSARRVSDLTLDQIAQHSGLTVRTVLRRFGSRDGVLEAAFARLTEEIKSLRRPTPPGDVDAAIASLIDQYEQIGDMNIRALREEDQLPLLHRILQHARRSHREWLREMFTPRLQPLAPDDREDCITALYAATDVYLWKLLRRDLNVDRGKTAATFTRLVKGVLASANTSHT